MHVIHMLTWLVYLKRIELKILVYVMSTVWEVTGGCAKQYSHALDIYLMNVLSPLYCIIMDHAINAHVHGKNIVDVLHATEFFIWRKKWNLLVN